MGAPAMAGDLGMSVSVDSKGASSLEALGRAMRAEEDGKQLRRDLLRELKKIMAPIVSEAKNAATGMQSAGLEHDGEPLRQAIARRIVGETRFSGKATGIRIRAKRKGMPRGFEHAPKRTNASGGWRRPVWGNREAWVTQIGTPNWFDDVMRDKRPEAREQCLAAMEETARRIKMRVQRGG